MIRPASPRPEFKSQRNQEIDGLRGWAAVCVVFFHFFREVFTKVHPEVNAEIFFTILNGPMMVQIFFILSGDALSMSFFRNDQDLSTSKIAVARYFRLTMPVLVTCALSFGILSLGLNYNLAAAAVVGREDWLGSFVNFRPDVVGFLTYAFAGVYLPEVHAPSYNPFLWTMVSEFAGSVLVFAFCFALRGVRPKVVLPILVVSFLFLATFQNPLAFFVFGMFVGALRTRGFFSRLHSSRWNWLILVLAISTIFYILPFQRYLISWVFGKSSLHLISDQLVFFFFPVVLVTILYASKHVVWFLSTRFSRYLGEISFPLYIFQFNVLISLTSFAVLKFSEYGILGSPFWVLIPVGSIVTTFVLAAVFRPLETRYLRLVSAWIYGRILLPKRDVSE